MKWWDRFICWLTGGIHWWVNHDDGNGWYCSDCGKKYVAGKDIP